MQLLVGVEYFGVEVVDALDSLVNAALFYEAADFCALVNQLRVEVRLNAAFLFEILSRRLVALNDKVVHD